MVQTTQGEGAGAGAAAPRPSAPELLGLPLLRTSWELLKAHWWKLIAVAACAYTAHHLLLAAAVWVGRAGGVPGLLAFSLVPIVPVLAVTMMLLILRRRQGARGGAAIMAAIGSVLVPFLVVYESQGTFLEDLGAFMNLGFVDDQDRRWAQTDGTFDSYNDLAGTDWATYRTPEPTSPLVLAVVVGAFLLRWVGGYVVEKDALWGSKAARGIRTALRVLMGYSEVVWIVLGALVVKYVVDGLASWWPSLRVGRGLIGWWDSVRESLPHLGAFGDWLVAAGGTVLDGVTTGLLSPLAWLAIGVVVYGLTASDGISENDVVASVQNTSRVGGLAKRLNPAVITLAWRRIADPEGRFGALLGGIAMILRSGFVPVVVFCLVYTLLDRGIPFVLWDLPRSLLRLEYGDWLPLVDPIAAIIYIARFCLTIPLLAVFADALLTRFGARSQLRLDPQLIGNVR